jgi:hypothetical protein
MSCCEQRGCGWDRFRRFVSDALGSWELSSDVGPSDSRAKLKNAQCYDMPSVVVSAIYVAAPVAAPEEQVLLVRRHYSPCHCIIACVVMSCGSRRMNRLQ